MRCLVLWCIVSIARAEDFAALPGVALSGASFDTSEEAFAVLYPSARKGAAGSSHQEYWVTQGSALYLVDFRSGKLAFITASLGKLADDEQRSQTSAIVEEMTKRFGAPKRVKTAKLLRRGAAETNALVFDLGTFQPDAKAVVESSELELAVTILNTNLRSLDRMFFSIEGLLAEVNKGAEQPKKALEPNTVVDYIRELPLRAETKPPESPTPAAATPLPASPVPTATPEPSAPAPLVAESPALVVERKLPLWLWVVGIATLAVVAWLVLKRRA